MLSADDNICLERGLACYGEKKYTYLGKKTSRF